MDNPNFLLSNQRDVAEFRDIIYRAYEREGRTFPWRENTDAWGILVSEFMLQQTQTARVVSYWNRWLEKWPSPASLSRVSLEEVLAEWSGLGYNRRARYLLECARIIVRDCAGKVPATPEDLAKLPGIGHYTAGAIACFAYDYPSVFIETNIRAVTLHFFFHGQKGITDKELLPILEAALDRNKPRKWYWALMDYGAALKKITANPNRRSAHYSRQSGFKGSLRQIRGSIVRALVSQGPASPKELLARLDVPAREDDFYKALESLGKESMVAEEGGLYQIKNISISG